MKIDINKKYRYRMGDPVRILCVDAVGPKCNGRPQPVAALDSKAGEVTFHFEDGGFDACHGNDSLDLIEVREPREWKATVIKGSGKLCAYDDGDEFLHQYEAIRVREIID